LEPSAAGAVVGVQADQFPGTHAAVLVGQGCRLQGRVVGGGFRLAAAHSESSTCRRSGVGVGGGWGGVGSRDSPSRVRTGCTGTVTGRLRVHVWFVVCGVWEVRRERSMRCVVRGEYVVGVVGGVGRSRVQ
jgi:hypothetical protein